MGTTDEAPAVVVQVSYSVDKSAGSEPGVGYQFVAAADEWAGRGAGRRVLLVCNTRSAVALRSQEVHLNHVEVVRIGLPERVEHLLDGPLERLQYLVWITRARRRVRRIAQNGEVRVFHHVTFGSEVLPAGLPARSAARRVWGPVGSVGDPRCYLVAAPDRSYALSAAAQWLRNRSSSALARMNLRRSDLVLYQSDVAMSAADTGDVASEAFPNFIPPADLRRLHASLDRDTAVEPGLRLVSIGQITKNKRVDLAVRALTDPRLGAATLTVLGDGPERDRVEDVARELGVTDRVDFRGYVSRAVALEILTGTSVLMHLSAREGASGVIAEATSLGVPVVCFEGTGGAATLRVGRGAGVAVDPRVRRADEATEQIASAVIEAASLHREPSDYWLTDRIGSLMDRIYA